MPHTLDMQYKVCKRDMKTSPITFMFQSDQEHIKVGILWLKISLKKKKSSVGEDVEHSELSHTLLEGMFIGTTTLRQRKNLLKLNTYV